MVPAYQRWPGIGAWFLVIAWGGVYPVAAKEKETDHPVTIEISPPASPVEPKSLPPLQIKFTANRPLSAMRVRVEMTGLFGLAQRGGQRAASRPAVAATQPARQPAPAVRKVFQQRFRQVALGQPRQMRIPMTCLPGHETGTVAITVEPLYADGPIPRTVRASINGYLADGRLYYGEQDVVALMQAHILDLEKAGAISREESLRRRQALTTVRLPASRPADGSEIDRQTGTPGEPGTPTTAPCQDGQATE